MAEGLTGIFLFVLLLSRSNIFFNITSPIPGTFIIALHYKGRDKAILEMDLKLDDLLEKVKNEHTHIPLLHVLADCAFFDSSLHYSFCFGHLSNKIKSSCLTSSMSTST